MITTRIRDLIRPVVVVLALLAHPAMAEEIELAVETAALASDSLDLPAVRIVLTPEARKTVAKLTLQHIGDVIELRVDGDLVMAPVVQSPILEGVVMISGSMTQAEARALAERLADRTARITLTPVAR